MGKDTVSDPDDDTGQRGLVIDFIGTALIVKDIYKPQYHYVGSRGGNHTFRIPVTGDLSYEYLIAGAWSGGAVYNSPGKFKEYVIKSAKEYNNPVKVRFEGIEYKDKL